MTWLGMVCTLDAHMLLRYTTSCCICSHCYLHLVWCRQRAAEGFQKRYSKRPRLVASVLISVLVWQHQLHSCLTHSSSQVLSSLIPCDSPETHGHGRCCWSIFFPKYVFKAQTPLLSPQWFASKLSLVSSCLFHCERAIILKCMPVPTPLLHPMSELWIGWLAHDLKKIT